MKMIHRPTKDNAELIALLTITIASFAYGVIRHGFWTTLINIAVLIFTVLLVCGAAALARKVGR